MTDGRSSARCSTSTSRSRHALREREDHPRRRDSRPETPDHRWRHRAPRRGARQGPSDHLRRHRRSRAGGLGCGRSPRRPLPARPAMKPPASTARLREALGIEMPILGAPMARIAGGRLATAVSMSAALGFLGGGYGDLDWIDVELAGIDVSTIGIGLITWKLDEQPAVLDAVLEHRPRALWLSYGDPAPYIASIHAAGAAAVCQVLDIEAAVAACDAGADVVVVQGSEAGGPGRPGRGLLTLFPPGIGRGAPLPLVAAGGNATRPQLAPCWQPRAPRVAPRT